MKKLIVMLFVMVVIAPTSMAQILKFTATTGDSDMDNFLIGIHNTAVKDINTFNADVSATFGIPIPKISATLKLLSPGDLYMAAQLSLSVNKPFDEVVSTYQSNKTKGWGAIAKEMGIKPGSAEFHAMKKSMKKGNGNSGDKSSNGNSGGKEKGKGKKK